MHCVLSGGAFMQKSICTFLAISICVLLVFMICGCNKNPSNKTVASKSEPAQKPRNIWYDLNPTGPLVDTILGEASHMYSGPEESWSRNYELQKLSEAGIKRFRETISWKDVEPADNEWHFENTDTLVDMAQEYGFTVDAKLCYGVDWAEPSGNDSDINPEVYADYVGHVAEHYCGTMQTLEIWNEPNLDHFWKPYPDPAHYGSMLIASYIAAKTACPDIKIVFGGLSSFDNETLILGFWNFLDRVWKAHPDIGNYFDIFAIHPYTLLQFTAPEVSLSVDDMFTWPDFETMIGMAKDQLSKMGLASMPIWETEFGWPSLYIGDEDQAAYLARALLISIKSGVEVCHWYTFWDGDGTNTTPTEDYFGLFTYPAGEGETSPKEAYYVLKGMHEVLGRSRFAADLSPRLLLPAGVYALAFLDKDTGAVIFAGWDSRTGYSTEVALPFPENATGYQLLNDHNDVIQEGDGDKIVRVILNKHVQYVKFED